MSFLFAIVSVATELKLVVMSSVHATIAASSSSIIKNVGWVSRSCRARDNNINRFATGLRPAFDRPATRTRHAHAGLRPGRRPGLRLDSVTEFGPIQIAWTDSLKYLGVMNFLEKDQALTFHL